jgi:hypothetical protein
MSAMRIALFMAALTLAGCSTPYLYSVGQEWQKQECRKIPDMAERARCEKSAATSYERYQAEVEAAKKAR